VLKRVPRVVETAWVECSDSKIELTAWKQN
jgi:hypothetical protein